MSRDERLEHAFGHADALHLDWQTEHPVVAAEEARLVGAAFRPLGARLLDVGCGEGATFWHLGAPAGSVGLDLFEAKLGLARQRMPHCRFVTGSALELPFADGSFDHIIARDLVHHLTAPERFVAEVARVLAPGGRFDLLEPCGLNPLVAAHALLRPVERMELRSTRRWLRRLVGARLRVESTTHHQPLPLHRIVYHPQLGRPSLAHSAMARAVVSGLERGAGRLLPRVAWAYLHVRAVSTAVLEP